jgi:hypothetical protein
MEKSEFGEKENDDDEDEPVRPCPNKEKGFIYDDPPDIGQIIINPEKEGQKHPYGLANLNNVENQNLEANEGNISSAASSSGLLLFIMCTIIGMVLFLAIVRFSKPVQKKYM